jgi:hypothetical protein
MVVVRVWACEECHGIRPPVTKPARRARMLKALVGDTVVDDDREIGIIG